MASSSWNAPELMGDNAPGFYIPKGPVGSSSFRERVQIAQTAHARMIKNCEPSSAIVYQQWPLWRFYMTPKGQPFRLTAVGKSASGTTRLFGMLAPGTTTVAVTHQKDLTPVDEWSSQAMTDIRKLGNCTGARLPMCAHPRTPSYTHTYTHSPRRHLSGPGGVHPCGHYTDAESRSATGGLRRRPTSR